ncbi:hypothetical protein G9463_11000 [Haloarcula sp. JP-Z28]|jgi:uncharacterized membrane protein YuzA (DUF378 family)|uniref:hypothetical protein n=1 Tax=Haloarcula TaxID=2237 RepID=UPI0003257F1F|nr:MULTISPECIES: hypothetical protein [Haloarcula]NHN63821.1 hypothetical protein [Haloarcula sp. JP-Z28]
MSLKEFLTHPASAATATATTLFGAFQFDVLAVLLQWGWANLGQLFYGATLLVSSAPVLPITKTAASKIVAGLAALLLLKLLLKAREQIDNRTDG